MADALDELTSKMQEGFQVDPTSLGEHPRYSQFKNLTKAAEQQAKRRQDTLERHADGRFDKLLKLRNLAMNEFSDEEDGEFDENLEDMDTHNFKDKRAKQRRARNRRYADQLMLSEWLVDIPSKLGEEWTMVASPKGKRCLVVASRGITVVHNKAGVIIAQFQSKLPGGNARAKNTYTILDCIYDNKQYYVLDLLSWNETDHAEYPYDLRQFMLNSKFEEYPEISQVSDGNKYPFLPIPKCLCKHDEMTKMMNGPMNFVLDGVLFYYNQVIYEAGQSPLVGWLKPFMLPEILNVPVAECYKQEGNVFANSRQFIDQFNEKHKHKSQIEKPSMDTS